MPEYPILQQNKPIGTLRVTREGLHTVFPRGRQRMRPGCGSPCAGRARARISV